MKFALDHSQPLNVPSNDPLSFTSGLRVHISDGKARPKVKEGEHVIVVAARKCRGGQVRFQVEDEVNDEIFLLQGGPTRERRES